MLTNKWIMFVLVALGVVVPNLAALPWTSVVTTATATEISFVTGLILAILHYLAPPVGQHTLTSTGGKFFTHN